LGNKLFPAKVATMAYY